MSGQSIQKKLYSAYGKVAKKLGSKFDVYRINTFTQPINEDNWVAAVYSAFSSDVGFSTPMKEKGESLYAWANGQYTKNLSVQVGDFIYDHQTGECFVINNQHLNKPLTAIQLTNTVTIYRSTYQDSGDGYQPENTPVVTDYPCVINGSGGSGGGFFIPSSTIMSAGVPSWQVTLWAPSGSIQGGDVFVDEHGNRTQVLTYDDDNGMYTISTAAFDPQ